MAVDLQLAGGVVSFVFRCRHVKGEPHPTDEASDVAWLNREEVVRFMSEAAAIRLSDAPTVMNLTSEHAMV